MAGDVMRLSVVFHESEILGAGVSVSRALGELEGLGWSASGWFPGSGPLVGLVSGLETVGVHEKPIAFSARGWRSNPGLIQRLLRTPAYLHAFDRWLVASAPDVVHVNSLLLLPEATIAHARGFPVVLQVHELPPSGSKRDLALRWSAAVADLLVGVSAPVEAMLLELAGRTPVRLIHNGVPVPTTRRGSDDTFVVGMIGHISRTKGTDVFLEAARLALTARPQLRFEHVGPARLWGDDVFDNQVEALATSPDLRGRLQLLGSRPAADELSRWSVFVLSSRQDAFPLSTLEAMAAGVPVVATAVGGIPEQIEHLETGILVPPDDPGAVSDWIVRLHDDGDLRRRLAEGAQERVSRVFSLRAQAQALDDAYAEAILLRERDGGKSRWPIRPSSPRLVLMSEPDRALVERHNRVQIEYFEHAGEHAMQPSDTPYVRRQVDRLVAFGRLLPGDRVLDVGCGMGRYTFALADRGLLVEGLDLSETLLQRFQEFNAGRYDIPLYRGDILDPPAGLDRRFDAVVGFFTLHHLHDVTGCLSAMRSLTKQGGRIVFLEPNPLNALYYVQMALVPGMSWSGDKGILKMREQAVFRSMRAAGLVDVSAERFGFFPPFIVNRSWGPPLEDALERLPWRRFLPFQLFSGHVPTEASGFDPGLE